MRAALSLPFFLTAASLAAQAPQSAESLRTFAPDALRVPLHRLPADDAASAAIGAAREGYKVFFDGGFELHPYLGQGRERNLPLSWRTRSVRFGGEELGVASAPRERFDAWHLELDHGGFRELYDLLPAGLEQSFAIEKRGADGDLVIEGAILSPLRAPRAAFAHQALRFEDAAGDAVLSYGAATAIDAAGRSLPVETACDGETISLRVPDAWLDGALFPIVVDPLVANTTLHSSSLGEVSSIEIAQNSETTTRNLLVAFTREFSATDHDVFVMQCDYDFDNEILAYSDIASEYSEREVCVAFAAGADRWLVAWQRDFSTATGDYSTIRVYFRDRDETQPNAGLAVSIQALFPESFTRPDLGGTLSGASSTSALLVYRRDSTSSRQNTSHSEIISVPINAATRTLLSADVAAVTPIGANLDREWPVVNQVRGPNPDGWTIAFRQVDATVISPIPTLELSYTDSLGAVVSTHSVASGSMTSSVYAPQIAGRSGKYVLAFGRTDLLSAQGRQVRTLRFDIQPGQSTPLNFALHVAAQGDGVLHGVEQMSIGYDELISSHWALGFTTETSVGPVTITQSRVLRLGGTGATTELQYLSSTPGSAVMQAVCYDRFSNSFAIAHASNATNDPVLGTRLEYPSTAIATEYGIGCGPAQTLSSTPYAGNTNFLVRLASAPPSTPAAMLFSLASSNIPLDFVGMTGCVANVDIGVFLMFTMGGLTGVNGRLDSYLPLPDDPLFIGDFFVQHVYLAPALNTLGVGATRGLHVAVR